MSKTPRIFETIDLDGLDDDDQAAGSPSPPSPAAPAQQASHDAPVANRAGSIFETIRDEDIGLAPEAPDAALSTEPASTGAVAANPEAPEAGGIMPSWMNDAAQWLGETAAAIDDSTISAARRGIIRSGVETAQFLNPTSYDLRQTELAKSAKDPKDIGFVGSVVSHGAQFLTGFLGAGKFIRLGGYAGALVKGAVADAVAFNPHDERLSNLVQRYPALRNPVTDFLAADSDDPAIVGRLKNAVEGAAIGVPADALIAAVRGLKALKQGDAAGFEASQEAVERLAKVTAPKVAPAVDETAGGRGAGEAATLPQAAAEGGEAAARVLANAPARLGDQIEGTGRSFDEVPSPDANEAAAVAPVKPLVTLSPEADQAFTEGLVRDLQAIEKHGSMAAAREAGYEDFATDPGTVGKMDFLNVLDTDDLMAATARIAKHGEVAFNAVRGGDAAAGVQSWGHVAKQAESFAAQFGADAGTMMQSLHADARGAPEMAARQVAYEGLARAMHVKTVELARLVGGGEEAFNARVAAGEAMAHSNWQALTDAFDHHRLLYADTVSAVKGLKTNYARTLGAMKLSKTIDPEALYRGGTVEDIARNIAAVGDDMVGVARAAVPERTAMQNLASFYTANLLSGPATHVISVVGNAAMSAGLIGRKVIGGAIGKAAGPMFGVERAEGDHLMREGLLQLGFITSVFTDARKAAARAFREDRNILDPGSYKFAPDELSGNIVPGAVDDASSLAGRMLGERIGEGVSAALGLAWKAQQLPFRAMGAEDEFGKQLYYRSAVKAQAAMEGIERGLQGADLERHVQARLNESIDAVTQQGLNADALREARVSTFQAPLAEGGIPQRVQAILNQNPVLRIVAVPFFKTPVNLLRESLRYTPGMNAMLADVRREWGAGGQQRLKVLGEMAIGMSLYGTAATLALNEKFTGGGPGNHKLRAELMKTGWRPYSYVTDNSDGSRTYVPLSNLDPFGMILGVTADLAEVANASERGARDDGLDEAVTAAFLAIVRNVQERNYLKGFNNLLSAMADGEGDKIARHAGSVAAGFVPFSSGVRSMNSDLWAREARTIVDRLKARVPGLSETLPAKRNFIGEPVQVQARLWSHREGDTLGDEVERGIEMAGTALGAPNPTYTGKGAYKGARVDLPTIRLADGRTAYDAYADYIATGLFGGKTVRERIEQAIEKPRFDKRGDGGVKEEGSRLGELQRMRQLYVEQAKKTLVREHDEVAAALDVAAGQRDRLREIRKLYRAVEDGEE